MVFSGLLGFGHQDGALGGFGAELWGVRGLSGVGGLMPVMLQLRLEDLSDYALPRL